MIKLREKVSYPVREAWWEAVPLEETLLGLLELVEYPKRDKTSRPKKRRYLVEELPRGPDGRRFQITKPAVTGGEKYYVRLTTVAGGDECTCRGKEAFGYCVHQEALRGLAAAGHLPAPTAPQPV